MNAGRFKPNERPNLALVSVPYNFRDERFLEESQTLNRGRLLSVP
jgi:hypothetical protein